jgi:hypothetical protein
MGLRHAASRARSNGPIARNLRQNQLPQLTTLPTLPERLALARAQQVDYVAFLTMLLADEVQRRDQQALDRHLL